MTTVPTEHESALAPPGRKPEPHEVYKHGHHWRNAADEAEGCKLGMWLFLSTEVLLFAGFFCAYAAFKMFYPQNWADASAYYLDWQIGAMNTVVLLLSSYTIVLAIRAAQKAQKMVCFWMLGITWLCALFFLVVKLGWEYYPKWTKGELPGAMFTYGGAVGDHDPIFLGIYWVSTATHGVHVLVGMIVIAWAMFRTLGGHYGPKNYIGLENIGLYWHIVDIIWIFLFPMLYLV